MLTNRITAYAADSLSKNRKVGQGRGEEEEEEAKRAGARKRGEDGEDGEEIGEEERGGRRLEACTSALRNGQNRTREEKAGMV